MLRVQQQEAFNRILEFLGQTRHRFFRLAGYAGTGKEQPVWCKVQTVKGSKKLGRLKIGDQIYGSNGELTTVTGIYPQGVKPCYKVTFRDNTSTYCGADHLWKVINKKGKESVVTTKVLMARGLTNSAGFKYRIPTCEPVQYEKKALPIHPYVLGAMLGDGSFRGKTLNLTIASFDHDIIKRVRKLEPRFKFKGRYTSDNCKQYRITDPGYYGNRFTDMIGDLGLWGLYSGEKFIPEQYLLSSIEDRWELLRGLMDTDGCCKEHGSTTFCTTSKRLKRDVKRLVQSLGGIAILPKHSDMNVKTFQNPFWLKRKAANWRLSTLNGPVRGIKSIKYVGEEEQMCISVSAKDHLYLTDNFIVTHNTYLLKELSAHNSMMFALYTATTNKATKVLSATLQTKSCKTIYSALGVKMVSDEDQMVLEYPRKIPDFITGFNVIVIDESSMLPADMVEFIALVAKRHNFKILFVADRAQNPPVGERESDIFRFNCPEYELTEVVRFDNQILRIATHVRKQVFKCPNHKLRIESDHSADEGVWLLRPQKFISAVRRASIENKFHEVDHTKVIAWRNKTVDEYNEWIRQAKYGDSAREPYLEGERVMIRRPVHVGNRILFHIDDEGTVTQVGVGYHGEHRTIDCFHMTVKFDDGRSGRLTVVTPDAQPALDSLLNNMALEAKKDKTKWGAFWAVNNAFHRVSYSYALTVHRAQGSTYKNVLVDRQDILRNVDEYDALRCLYVAYSRPTKILVTN